MSEINSTYICFPKLRLVSLAGSRQVASESTPHTITWVTATACTHTFTVQNTNVNMLSSLLSLATCADQYQIKKVLESVKRDSVFITTKIPAGLGIMADDVHPTHFTLEIEVLYSINVAHVHEFKYLYFSIRCSCPAAWPSTSAQAHCC